MRPSDRSKSSTDALHTARKPKAEAKTSVKVKKDSQGTARKLTAEQWEQSNYINRDKLFGPASSLSLENLVTPRHINPVDFRHLAAPTHLAGKSPYHAFTRGDATTGWNFGTVADEQFAKQQLASTLAKSQHNSRNKAAKIKQYKTPEDRSAAVTQKVKESKQAAAMQLVQLEQKYGKEGAAAMQQIMQMTPLKYKWDHKAKKGDLKAVVELDNHMKIPDAPVPVKPPAPVAPKKHVAF